MWGQQAGDHFADCRLAPLRLAAQTGTRGQSSMGDRREGCKTRSQSSANLRCAASGDEFLPADCEEPVRFGKHPAASLRSRDPEISWTKSPITARLDRVRLRPARTVPGRRTGYRRGAQARAGRRRAGSRRVSSAW
jgi:hypothetical protein